MIQGECVSQIIIGGGGTCYNGCIEKLQGGFIMFYRRNLSPVNRAGIDIIEYVFLDNDFGIMSTPRALDLGGHYFEDPRIIICQNRIFLFVGGPDLDPTDWRSRRIYIAELLIIGSSVSVKHPPVQLEPPFGNAACEKNWVPFIYQGEVYLVYSITPHIVMKLDLSDYSFSKYYVSNKGFKFPGGSVSCGTPPKKTPYGFLTFFHSVEYPFQYLSLSANVQERQKSHTRHYSMGAYFFSTTPPFEISHVIGSSLSYDGCMQSVNKRVTREDRVMFPAGMVIDNGKTALVSVGENDTLTKIVAFDIFRLNEARGIAITEDALSVHDRYVPCKIYLDL